jgi:hypothetical protein
MKGPVIFRVKNLSLFVCDEAEFLGFHVSLNLFEEIRDKMYSIYPHIFKQECVSIRF